jgi:hypothetical protein
MALSKQEIFDRVAVHLLTQNERSADEIFCKYRGPEGRMCAVGCLIPDEVYDIKMEGLATRSLIDHHPVIKDLFEPDALGMLGGLQNIHDHKNIREWKQALIDLATANLLDYKVVTNFKDGE